MMSLSVPRPCHVPMMAPMIIGAGMKANRLMNTVRVPRAIPLSSSATALRTRGDRVMRGRGKAEGHGSKKERERDNVCIHRERGK